LSLALGNASATPLQMASAYAIFANGGFRVQPYFIQRIEDGHHTLLEQAEPLVACKTCEPAREESENPAVMVAASAATDKRPRVAPRAVSPEISFLMASMLQDVVREGTGGAARVLGRKDIGGKTGTTDEYRDAWFSGFNEDVVATAWIGFDQGTSLGRGEAGARAALPIWIDYMRVALEGVPQRTLEPPEGIVKAYVDSETGAFVSDLEPNAMEEYFVLGTEGLPVAVTSDPSQTDAGAPTTPPVVAKPPDTQQIRDRLF
jgi:penicillin-binding protein 1A